LAKLEIMQRYAYAKSCRRSFILRYFGDPAATGECAGCDNCLGNHRPAVAPAKVTPRGGGVASRRRRAPAAADAVAGVEAGPLFSALRALRTTLARRDGLPAYIVFPDSTLAEIAARRPASLAALADVRGVGPAKLERYGAQFLAEVRAHDRPAPTDGRNE
jgi:ATP-dependent DNA helicase RecQ